MGVCTTLTEINKMLRFLTLTPILFFLVGCFEGDEGDPQSYQNLDEWSRCHDSCNEEFHACVDAGNTQSACGLQKLTCEKGCGEMPME